MSCQSFAPGHNVHWIQARIAGPPVPAVVTPVSPDRTRLGELQRPFRLALDSGGKERLFFLHNADRLASLLADPTANVRYSEDKTLLRVSTSDSTGCALFYPCFGKPKQCIQPAEPEPAEQQPAQHQTELHDPTPTKAPSPLPDTRKTLLDNKVLRASGWIWIIHELRFVGVCPDCGVGVQVRRYADLARTIGFIDEAESLHGCSDRVEAPTTLIELYGISHLARRFGFPEELLPDAV